MEYSVPSRFTVTQSLPIGKLGNLDKRVNALENNVIEYNNAVDFASTVAILANTYSNGTSGVGATLTGTSTSVLAIDGNIVSVGQRVLVKDEAAASHHGVYTVTVNGGGKNYVLTRTTDADTDAKIRGGVYYVMNGTANKGKIFSNTNTSAITVGTTSITYGNPVTSAGGTSGQLIFNNAGVYAGVPGTGVNSGSGNINFSNSRIDGIGALTVASQTGLEETTFGIFDTTNLEQAVDIRSQSNMPDGSVGVGFILGTSAYEAKLDFNNFRAIYSLGDGLGFAFATPDSTQSSFLTRLTVNGGADMSTVDVESSRFLVNTSDDGSNDIQTGSIRASAISATTLTTTGNVTSSAGDVIATNNIGGNGIRLSAVAQGGNTTATISDFEFSMDASGGARTVTFPIIGTLGAGKLYLVLKTDSTTNAVTPTPTSTNTMNGGAAGVGYAMTKKNQYTLWMAIGSNWQLISQGYLDNTINSVALTTQSADITTTNFVGGNTAGTYRLDYSLQDTTADAAAGTVTLTIGYTDGAGATTFGDTQVLTGTGRKSGSIFIQLASGNITYATSHTGIYGTAKYALYMTLERLS